MLLKNDYALLDEMYQDEKQNLPAITKWQNKLEAKIFLCMSLLPRAQYAPLTVIIIWFFTTFQFGRFLSEDRVTNSFDSGFMDVFVTIFRNQSVFPHEWSPWLPPIVSAVIMYSFVFTIFIAYNGALAYGWVLPTTLLSNMIVWAPTVLFFPVTHACWRVVLGCININLDSINRHPFLPTTCGSMSHVFLLVFLIIGYILFFIACYITTSCVFETAIPLNPNTRFKHLSSRTNNTPELMGLIIKFLTTGIYVFAHNNDWRWALGPILAISGFILSYYHYFYLPFYTDITQIAYNFQGMFITWTGIVVFLEALFANGNAVGLLYVSVTPILFFMSVLLHSSKYEAIASYSDKDQRSRNSAIVHMKGLIRNFLALYSMFDDLYVEHSQDFMRKREKMFQLVAKSLEVATIRFPNDAELHTLLGNFLAHVVDNRVLAYAELDYSEKLAPNFSVRFLNYELRTYLDAETSKNLNSEIRAFAKFKMHKEKGDEYMTRASACLMKFWTNLLTGHIVLDDLTDTSGEAYFCLKMGRYHYDALLDINKNSIPILKIYSRICLELLMDTKMSKHILDHIDRVEREDAQRVRSAFDDSKARVNTIMRIKDERLDIFDERLGVALVSMNASTRGIIESANPSWVRAFGYRSANDIVGKNVNILIPEPIAQNHNDLLTGYLERKTSTMLGRTVMFLAKHQLSHIFPIDLYFRWSDEAKGKMVAVAKVIPCDQDIYLVLDTASKIVAYTSLSLYSLFGVSKRDVFARKVEICNFIPGLKLIVNDDTDNSVVIEQLWEKMISRNGLETTGTHVLTNKVLNTHIWVTPYTVFEDSCYLVKISVSQIDESLYVVDSDSDDDTVGHTSYVNRFNEKELNLELDHMSLDYMSQNVAVSPSMGLYPGPALSTLSKTGTHPFSVARTHNSSSMIRPGTSNTNNTNGKPPLHPQYQSPIHELSLDTGNVSVHGGNYGHSASGSVHENDSFGGSESKCSTLPSLFHAQNTPLLPLNMASQSTLSMANVSLHFNNTNTNSFNFGQMSPSQKGGVQQSQSKFQHLLSPSLANNKTHPQSTKVLPPDPELTRKQEEAILQRKGKTMLLRLNRALNSREYFVSRDMTIMKYVTFFALMIMVILSTVMYVMTSNAFEVTDNAFRIAYYGGLRHAYMLDAVSHLQALHIIRTYQATNPNIHEFFYREYFHKSNSYVDVTSGSEDRAIRSLQYVRQYSLFADHTFARTSTTIQDELNTPNYALEFFTGASIAHYTDGMKGMIDSFLAHSYIVQRNNGNSDANYYFVVKNGLDVMGDAVADLAYKASRSLANDARVIELTILILFAVCLVTVVFVMPLVILPVLLKVESDKREIVQILKEIPRRVRKRLRRQAHRIHKFLNTDLDKENEDGEDQQEENEEDDEEAEKVPTQKHNYGRGQNKLTTFERYMTKQNANSIHDDYEDEIEMVSMSKRNGNVHRSILHKAVEQVNSKVGMSRSLVMDSRARSVKVQESNDKHKKKDEDGAEVNLDRFNRAAKQVVNDESNNLLYQNGRIIRANEGDADIEMTRWEKFVHFLKTSSVVHSLVWKFAIFMVLMILYFIIIYIYTADTMSEQNMAMEMLRLSARRLPIIQYVFLVARANTLFAEAYMALVNPFEPMLSLFHHKTSINERLEDLQDLQQTIEFGNPTIGVRPGVDYNNQNRIHHSNLCTIPEDDTVKDIFTADYFPNFFKYCPVIAEQSALRGGKHLATMGLTSIILHMQPQLNGIFVNVLNAFLPMPPEVLAVQPMFMAMYKVGNDVIEDFASQFILWSMKSLYQMALSTADAFNVLRLVLYIVFILVIVFMYLFIFHPVWDSLRKSINDSRSMLLLIPPPTMVKLTKLEAFIQHSKKVEL